jgi:2-polyprenyl-3-methyl-5-hydroxy-6-metoxy-1,4-benzoquinol methylase
VKQNKIMETLHNCPICNGKEFNPFLSCTDYTVSRETFHITQCKTCGFRFTNPRPKVEDLAKFYESEDYISHSNTNKGLVNWVYQQVRKYTLLKKLQLISKHKRTGKILDIGCGTGEFLNTCKLAKWETLGIEPSENARTQAIKKFGLNVFIEDAIDTLPSTTYDVITMWHVLEHVPDLNKRMKDLERLITNGGIILIAVPNPNSFDAIYYKEHWAAYDLPRHLYHFTPNDIETLCNNNQLKVKRILPMVFDSFYISMLSEKYKNGKTNLIRSTWNGLLSNLKALKTGKEYSSQIYVIGK